MKPPACRVLPVFPLPGVVLFPQVLLPLHIFEPRYRTMLEEVLDGHGRIAMALAIPGGDPDDESLWSIPSVVGVGQVMTYRARGDGTSDVLLQGEFRGRLEEWIEGKPFRTGRVSALADVRPRSQVLRDRMKAELRGHLDAVLRNLGREKDLTKLNQVFVKETDVGFLADFLAYHFLHEPEERQTVLEELEVERRVNALREFLSQRGLI